jgi:PAS domain S-box-containing protein
MAFGVIVLCDIAIIRVSPSAFAEALRGCMGQGLRVLVVEKDDAGAELLLEVLKQAYSVVHERIDTPSGFTAALERGPWDLLFAADLPHFSSMDARQLALARGLDLPLLVLCDPDEEPAAQAAMRAGARDYFVHGSFRRLLPVVERELREASQRAARCEAEARAQAFSLLGQRLSAAATPEAAARIVIDVADRLVGWDACWLDLYDAATDTLHPVLRLDEVDGKRVDLGGGRVGPPGDVLGGVIRDGGRLLLREPEEAADPSLRTYGDVQRRSASLMFVPIRDRLVVRGLLSIQSYTPRAYSPADLATVQSLADHCGGAFGRIWAEEQQRASEARLQSILDNIGALVCVLSPDGRYLMVNGRYAQLIGLSAEALTVHTLHEVFPKAVADGFLANNREVLAADRPLEFEETLAFGDSPRTYLSVKVPLHDGGGRPYAICGIMTDITERLKAEEKVRQAREAAEAAAALANSLQGVASALSESVSVEQVLTTLIHLGMPALETDAGAVALLSADGRHLDITYGVGYREESLATNYRAALDAPTPLTEAARMRQPIWLASSQEYLARYPKVLRGPLTMEAHALLPMVVEGRLLGVMALSFRRPQTFSPGERSYMAALASHGAQALERARLYEAERRANAALEERVKTRTAELEREMERRQRVQQQLERSREEERTRIAREIHDELGGALTGAKMELARLHKELSAEPALRRWNDRLDTVQDLIDMTAQAVRRISHQLRPSVLDDLGLLAALEWLAQDFRARTGIPTAYVSDVEAVALPDGAASALFRIAQEALTNVARHAEATQAEVRLRVESGVLNLEVRDNGRGISTGDLAKAQSLGLVGIRERAHLIGAAFEIRHRRSGGTLARVALPLPVGVDK